MAADYVATVIWSTPIFLLDLVATLIMLVVKKQEDTMNLRHLIADAAAIACIVFITVAVLSL